MKNNKKAIRGLLMVSVSAVFLGAGQANSATFSGLGAFASNATGISADGSTVIGYGPNALGTEAFRWTQSGGLQSLGVISNGVDHNSYAGAVSADGSVIAGYSTTTSGAFNAFRWTQATGMVSLGGVGGNDGFTRADDMSDDGSTIVGYSQTAAAPNGAGYRWNQANGIENIGTLSAPYNVWSWARGISADGSTIVGQSNSFSSGHAFRWSESGGFVDLGVAAGASSSGATDIANNGTIVGGGKVGTSNLAMIRTEVGGWEILGTLAGYNNSSEAGISADGSLVYGMVFNLPTTSTPFTQEGMVWDSNHGMRFADDWLTQDHGLDLSDWTIQYVSGISDDGLVAVGYGLHNGNVEAWVADLRPVPIPGAVWLFGSAIAGLSVVGRKRK